MEVVSFLIGLEGVVLIFVGVIGLLFFVPK